MQNNIDDSFVYRQVQIIVHGYFDNMKQHRSQQVIADMILRISKWYDELCQRVKYELYDLLLKTSDQSTAVLLICMINDMVKKTIVNCDFRAQNRNQLKCAANKHVDVWKLLPCSKQLYGSEITAFDVGMLDETPLDSMVFLLCNRLVATCEVSSYLKCSMIDNTPRKISKILLCARTAYMMVDQHVISGLTHYICVLIRMCHDGCGYICELIQSIVEITGETGINILGKCQIMCTKCFKTLRGKRVFNMYNAMVFLDYLLEFVTEHDGNMDPYVDLFESALNILRHNPQPVSYKLARIIVLCSDFSKIDSILQEYCSGNKWPGLIDQMLNCKFSHTMVAQAIALNLSIKLSSAWCYDIDSDKNIDVQMIPMQSIMYGMSCVRFYTADHLNILCHGNILKCYFFVDYLIAAHAGAYAFFTILSDEELLADVSWYTWDYMYAGACYDKACANFRSMYRGSGITTPLEILFGHMHSECALSSCIDKMLISHIDVLYKSIDMVGYYAHDKCSILMALYGRLAHDIRNVVTDSMRNAPPPICHVDDYIVDIIMAHMFPYLR